MGSAKVIGLDIIVTQAPGLVTADMDGETVMLNIENGKYFGLDSIGSRIWELIEEPYVVRDLVAALQKDYDVEENDCQNDTLMFLNTLHDKGLIKID